MDINQKKNSNIPEKKNRRRTLFERVEDIFRFINSQDEIFPKSRLQAIGLNPKSAEKWLKLIEFIQNQPRIRIIESEYNIFIKKLEGRYQILMRKMMLDDTLPFEQRYQHASDYVKSLYSLERMSKMRGYGKNLDFKNLESLKEIIENLGIDSLEGGMNLAGVAIVSDIGEIVFQTANWDLSDLPKALSSINEDGSSFQLNKVSFEIIEKKSDEIIATNLDGIGHLLFVYFQGGILLSYALPQANIHRALKLLREYAEKLDRKI